MFCKKGLNIRLWKDDMKIPVLPCLLNRHDPIRALVSNDGIDYSGVCRRCGKPIRRVSQGDWRRSLGK